MAKTPVQFILNGTPAAVFVDGGGNLLTALREGVGDTAPKFGCGQGACGTCTKPCVRMPSNGARPRVAQLSSSDDWNQPRCWSEPSR